LVVQVIWGEHEWHCIKFFDSDAVFTGDGSAEGNAFANDFFARFYYFFDDSGFSVIKVEKRVEVSVASVKNICHTKSVFDSDGVDKVEHFWEFASWYDAVVRDDGWSEASHGADAFFACHPEFGSLFFICGDGGLYASKLLTDLLDGFQFCFDLVLDSPVTFDEKEGEGVGVELKIKCLSHGVHDAFVHHFKGGGKDSVGNDAGNTFGCGTD